MPPWDRYSAGGPPAVIEGPPRLPAPQTQAQAQGDELANERRRQEINSQPIQDANTQAQTARTQIEVAQEQERMAARANARNARGEYVRNVLGAIGGARTNISGWSTGLASQVLGNVGGTQAHDLRNQIDTVISNVGFDRLQQMRAESPTGGALGQVSDFENRMLQSSLASLQTSQSQAQLRENLDKVELHYLNVINLMEGRPHARTLEEARQIHAGQSLAAAPGAQAPGGGGSGSPDPDVIDLGPVGALVDPQGLEVPYQPSNLHSLGVGTGAVVEGVGDILGIVGNPLNHSINALLGTNLSTDLGQSFLDASGLPSPSTRGEELAAAMTRGGIGGLTLAGGARAAAPYATNALAGALTRFGAAPAVDAAGGAAGGASAEFARQQGAGPAGQIAAGLVGGLGGALGAQRLGLRFSPPASENALLRAGREEGVEVNRAMADPRTASRVSATDGTVIGRTTIRGDMGRVGSQIEGRVNRLGRGGTPLDETNAGQTVRGALERNIRDSGRRAGELYDAAEVASQGVRVQPQQSLRVIDDAITRLSETPETNGAEIAFLQTLRRDFSNDLSVSALRRIRTQLRSRIANGGLTFGEDEASILSIMDSASQDIEAGLREAGRGRAAELFRRADGFYRERMEFINGTAQRLIGRRHNPLSPERVFANLQSMARPRGDSAALARVIRTMEPDEQADIAATFAEALGRNSHGEFSTAHFVSQARRLPRAARVNIFGPEGARSIENLERLAREHARVTGAFNHSNTSLGSDARSWLTNFILSGGGILAVTESTPTAIAAAGAAASVKGGRDLLSARALMSTDLTQWLARTPRGAAPAAMQQHIARLGTIAARNPAISEEVRALQQRLNAVFEASPTSAAAAEQDE